MRKVINLSILNPPDDFTSLTVEVGYIFNEVLEGLRKKVFGMTSDTRITTGVNGIVIPSGKVRLNMAFYLTVWADGSYHFEIIRDGQTYRTGIVP